MSHLPSSMRAARGALHSLTRKSPQSFFRPDSLFGSEAILLRHVSARTIGGTAAGSSFVEVRQNASAGNDALRENCRDIHRRPLSWTVRNAISTSATLLDPDVASNILHAEDNVTDLPEEKRGGVVIPFRHSGREKSRAESSDFDDRAQAKLTALSKAKAEAAEAKSLFLSSENNADAKELREKWNASEKNLALAYSQAIKYVSRIPKSEDATKTAERLLSEWMGRFSDSFAVPSSQTDDSNDAAETKADAKPKHLGKKRTVRAIHAVMSRLAPREGSSESEPAPPVPEPDKGEVPPSTLPEIRMPPPASKDYINLLRAYSDSKAKRKGRQCEVLMGNMMRIAERVVSFYDERGDESTNDRSGDVGMETVAIGDGNETELWRLWARESIPDSKAFALAIKCHAGTTHNDALERVIALNDIHDSFSECCPWMYKDDPYVLFNSIKALKNLQRKDERSQGHLWLRKLHNFVTSPENADYFEQNEGGAGGSERSLQQQSEESDKDDAQSTSSPEAPTPIPQTIDVTSAYTTFLRLLARLRGTKGATTEALSVLDRMHRVQHIVENGLPHPEENSENELSEGASARQRSIASIDIRANAYNLVLGLYRDSKKVDDATNAIELLKRMVDAGNQAPEDRRGMPLPTEQSFEYTILSLANLSDGEKAVREAERLIQLMRDQSGLESFVSAYNAHITVCNRQLSGVQLYDKAVAILEEINNLAKTNPSVAPNPKTLELVMQSCSLSGHDDHEKVLATASKLFSQLEEQESSEKSSQALTDRAYFCMMRCVNAYMIDDPDGKKDRIEGLFSEACQRGLVSAKVLEMFRNSVSKEDYRLTVGEGRLADHWVANIRGPRALYTDGSSGGAGKHARRKGKSTSDWAKKKRAKESKLKERKKEKQAKKFFKKMKMSS